MKIEEARDYLKTVMSDRFTDQTFERYITHTLAGDFAVEVANTIRGLDAQVTDLEKTNDFDAKRLRRLAILVGASAPESDETMLACAGTVLGAITRQVESGFKRSSDGWVSTKDQLPQEGQEVTIRMMHGQIRQAVKDKGYAGGWRQPNCAGWEIVTWHGDTITHWRPEIFERPSKDGY